MRLDDPISGTLWGGDRADHLERRAVHWEWGDPCIRAAGAPDSLKELVTMAAISTKPIRVLHVVGGMARGGVETWLMHVLRHIDRERFQIDFLVHTTRPCPYDNEVRALGSHIIPCMQPSKPWMYAQNFRRILREHGPYDVVHSHVHHYSGYILRLSEQAGVPVRIAHSHSDTSMVQAKAGLLRRGYLTVMRHWIDQHATVELAASRRAAEALFGAGWQLDPRRHVLHCGVDLSVFHQQVDRDAIRVGLGIPQGALVLGHVGRFDEPKNHAFLIKIAAEVIRREPRAYLLLVGEGPLLPQIRQQVVEAGLEEHVIFTGLRSDVPRLMRGVMDVFVFPSLYEGLPVVGIEAQAAGIPLLLSDTITEEVTCIDPLVRRMSLAQPVSAWAEAVLEIARTPVLIANPLALVAQSSFNIVNGLKALESVYACA